MTPLIEFAGVGKTFPGVVALDGVGFRVAPGEVRALIGENGAGKSTLLKILGGQYRPTAGTLLVDGAPVAFAAPADSQAAGIAIIHQELQLFPDLSVAENLMMGVLPARAGLVDRAALRSRARAVLDRLGEAIDPDARLLQISRHKGDQEGEGATAFLSPRTVSAISAWREAARIDAGPIFRRVQVRRYKARAAMKGRSIDSISSRETWDLRKTLFKPAVKARVEYDIGSVALHPGSIGTIFRSIIQRSFDLGALPDLTAEDLARLLKGVSAHSTRIGLNQDLFASGEDLAGIMDALRWKSPRMPLAYNRNLAAEHGAAGRLMAKIS